MERGDHQTVGDAVQGVDRRARELLREQHHRRPAGEAVPPVDPPDQPLDAVPHGAVGRDAGPARHARLHEDEAAVPFRIQGEEAVHREQPLRDALGVVEAVEADHDLLADEAVLLAQPHHLVCDVLSAALHIDLLRVHADGERAHEGGVAAVRNRRALPVHVGLELAAHRVQEIVAVQADVETEHVVREQALEDLALPRAGTEHLRRRPRDVPEVRDGEVGARRLEHAGQERQVVVVHPHRSLRRRLFQDGAAEVCVDGLVLLPVTAAERGADVDDVTQRPQGLVGEAVVVAALLLLGQPHAPERVARLAGRHHDAPVRVHHLAVGRARAVSDPGASDRAHDRIHRGHETARRTRPADLALVELVEVGLAVGHDDEVAVAEPPGDEIPHALRRPDLGGRGHARGARRPHGGESALKHRASPAACGPP